MVLLDSEGIDAVMGEGLDDHQILTFIVLLASVFFISFSLITDYIVMCSISSAMGI